MATDVKSHKDQILLQTWNSLKQAGLVRISIDRLDDNSFSASSEYKVAWAATWIEANQVFLNAESELNDHFMNLASQCIKQLYTALTVHIGTVQDVIGSISRMNITLEQLDWIANR